MNLSGMLYQCVAGETFDSVALEIYGNEKYACELLTANPELCLVTMFSGGEFLSIPVVEIISDEDEEEETVPVTAPWKE
mgnify:FL=1